MRDPIIDPSLFITNRKRFTRELESNALAIFHSNDLTPRNGDQYYPYRQQSDFFYLTGIAQPNSILVLFPSAGNRKMKEVLFIEKTSREKEIWEGKKLNREVARDRSGIQTVFWADRHDKVLHDALTMCERIYVNENESAAPDNPIISRDLRMAKALREKYPFHKYHRAQPIMRKLRMQKSTEEIRLMREAIRITQIAFEQIISRKWIDLFEYKIEAVMTGTFINEGAAGHAYAPIVAAGESACILHYTENSRKCHNGDLILLDFGAEYGHYAADLSRTIPANGRFNKRQRAVYQAVLHVLRQSIPLLVPGALLTDIRKSVGRIMSEQLSLLNLLTDEEAAMHGSPNPPYAKYFMHGISHHLGLDVHDLCDRDAPLQPGMVLTCEPGIYIADEGLGVRLENNILITDEGPLDLTADVPIEIEDIENRMN